MTITLKLLLITLMYGLSDLSKSTYGTEQFRLVRSDVACLHPTHSFEDVADVPGVLEATVSAARSLQDIVTLGTCLALSTFRLRSLNLGAILKYNLPGHRHYTG